MKKLLILFMLVFSVFSTCFAYHAPDKDELYKLQSLFSGYYFNKTGKELVNSLTINEDGSVEFYHHGVFHNIKEPHLEVDYNNDTSIRFLGNCADKDCNFQGWRISLSPLGYLRASNGYSFSLVLLKMKENIKKEEVKTPDDLFDKEHYVVVKK